MAENSAPAAPAGLHEPGRKLWQATVADYELAEHETGLLLQACHTVDALAELQSRLDADGPMVSSPQGLKAHPALPELRQQRIALARLLAALGLPTGVEAEQPKQRRSARGVYVVGGT